MTVDSESLVTRLASMARTQARADYRTDEQIENARSLSAEAHQHLTTGTISDDDDLFMLIDELQALVRAQACEHKRGGIQLKNEQQRAHEIADEAEAAVCVR